MNEFTEDKTYEQILSEMLEDFKSRSGYDADNASDIGIRMRVLAGQIFSLNKKINWIWKQSSPNTAEGEYLDNHAYEKGIERIRGEAARGTLKFFLAEPLAYDVDIEAGTLTATGTLSSAVKFKTLAGVTIPAGELSVSVGAQAEESGIKGNVPAGAVKVILDKLSASVSVTNEEAFAGGIENETDESLRARIVESYQYPALDRNESYFRSRAMSCSGVISVGVIPKARGIGTVDLAIETASRKLDSSISKSLRDVFVKNKDFGCDVLFVLPDYTEIDVVGDITVENGFSSESVIEKCTDIITESINALGVGDGFILAEIYHRLMEIPGVKNAVIYKPNEDVAASQKVRLLPGKITLNAVKRV